MWGQPQTRGCMWHSPPSVGDANVAQSPPTTETGALAAESVSDSESLMLFDNVALVHVSAVDAPHRIASRVIMSRLRPTLDKLGIHVDLLGAVAGIHARRFWERDVKPSDAAAMAGRRALQASGVPGEALGVLVNTSVCRDWIEPSTAAIAHAKLGLPPDCLNFDVGNACLAFLTGMEIVGNMIERGQVQYGMVVDGESSRFITEQTVRRLLQPGTTLADLQANFASLTLGSGAAAAVLGRADLHPSAPRFKGAVNQAATQHHGLCQGEPDKMITNSGELLVRGVELAQQTWASAEAELGWKPDDLDRFCLHQVSGVHTKRLAQALDLKADRIPSIYPEFGNIGPASVPIVLARAAEEGGLEKGSRIGLLGIGSGLNCTMAEVVW